MCESLRVCMPQIQITKEMVLGSEALWMDVIRLRVEAS